MGLVWRYWLEHEGQLYELTLGTTLLGRSDRCQVFLDDALVSRHHARIIIGASANGKGTNDESARIEDAGSSNGVFLNGMRVQSADLSDRDVLSVGKQKLVFRCEQLRSRRREHTMAETMHGATIAPGSSPLASTVQREPLELLAPLIDKALVLGRTEEAERLLEPHLRRHMSAAGIEPRNTPHVELAVTYALRLAEITRAARWVDYCFELYTLLRVPLPAAAVEQLYTTLRGVPGVSLGAHRKYVEVLDAEAPRLGPRERFLVQRISGLEKLVR